MSAGAEVQTAEGTRTGHLALLDSILFILDDAPQRKFNIAPSDEYALRNAVHRASVVVRNATFTERQEPRATKKKAVLQLVHSA